MYVVIRQGATRIMLASLYTELENSHPKTVTDPSRPTISNTPSKKMVTLKKAIVDSIEQHENRYR